jgi:hypothetical protein
MVFTEIDYAAAEEIRPRPAAAHGHHVRQSKARNARHGRSPLLTIDVPPKALVWEDDQGKVCLSYKSSDYLYNTIYPRHGAAAPPSTAPFAKLLDEISDQARSRPAQPIAASEG